MGCRDHAGECSHRGLPGAGRSRHLTPIAWLFAAASSLGLAACVLRPDAALPKHVAQDANHGQIKAWSEDDLGSVPMSPTVDKTESAAQEGKSEQGMHGSIRPVASDDKHAANHPLTVTLGVVNDDPLDRHSDESSSTAPPEHSGTVTMSSTDTTDTSGSIVTSLQKEREASYVSLLLAFLIGLALGIGLGATLLLRRRRTLRIQAGSKEYAEGKNASRPVSTLPVHAEVSPELAPARSETAGSDAPAASYGVPSSVTGPSAIWTAATRKAVDLEPVVVSIQHGNDVATVPFVSLERDVYSPLRDMRRAGLLLEQGALERALAVIEPHLQGFGRERPVLACEQYAQWEVELYFDHTHPAPAQLAELHADIRWQMAARDQRDTDYELAAGALETYLALVPGDSLAHLRLGYCLVRRADAEPDDMAQAVLLQSCIDLLSNPEEVSPAWHLARLGVLGEALGRRALLDPSTDAVAEAEHVLREALALGATDSSGVSWWLQKLLAAEIPSVDPVEALTRLQESIVLSRLGLSACMDTPDRPRWQAALLRAELREALLASSHVAARRLRLRELHARYVRRMLDEPSAEVLAAWVELLCALAEPLMGSAALERYREVDHVLDRLSASDQQGRLHAAAWVRMVHGRLPIENASGRRDLIERATTVLDPCMDAASDSLRLNASLLALEQALLMEEVDERNKAYSRALEWARPLTAVPSVAQPALGCALKALLAMNEDKERRVYARCLSILEPEDAQSLGLLAESAYRDGHFVEACQYFEKGWLSRPDVWPHAWLDPWRHAHAQWLKRGDDEDACQRNQRYLRQASSRRCK
jgi:tetratricopeptide (TPR) repeat protein